MGEYQDLRCIRTSAVAAACADQALKQAFGRIANRLRR